MAGHPPDISEEQAATIRQRRAEGATLRAIGEELGIHHSTVEQHCKDRPLEPADRYAELVELLKEKIEANFFEALAAAEKTDYRLMRDVMQRRAVLAQQAKGLLSMKPFYVTGPAPTSEPNGEAEDFLASLAEEAEPKRKRKRKTTT